MKKLITAATALALAAGMASAQVESANIVGYQAHATVGGNFNMPAVQFNVPGGASIAINDLFADTTMLTQGTGVGDADNIRVWNPVTSGYATYFLYDNGEDGYYPDWDGKWIDFANFTAGPTTDTLAPGTPFWLLRQGGADTNLTTAGEVPSAAEFPFNITKGNFNMIANPYPTDLALNGTNFVIDAAKVVQGTGVGDADNIRVWNPVTSGYATYFLYDNGEDGYYPEWDGKWIDFANFTAGPTAGGLPAGAGAWYLSQPATASDWTLTIKKPY